MRGYFQLVLVMCLTGCAYRPHPAPLTGGITQFKDGLSFRTVYPESWYHELGTRRLLPATQPTITWIMYAVNTNHPVYGPVSEWGIVHVEGTNAGTIVIMEKSELTNAVWTDIGTLTFSPTTTNDLYIVGGELPDHLFHGARLLTP